MIYGLWDSGGGYNFAPDESCEADVSGLASFILFEGDGGVSPAVSPIVSALSLDDAANVTSFVGLDVRLSSSVVAASPIVDWSSMRSWGGGSTLSSSGGRGCCGWGLHSLRCPALNGGFNEPNMQL